MELYFYAIHENIFETDKVIKYLTLNLTYSSRLEPKSRRLIQKEYNQIMEQDLTKLAKVYTEKRMQSN